MSRATHYGLLALLWLVGAAWPTPAVAEVRRCVRPDGDVIYTDRRCEDFGAVEQAPRSRAAGNTRIYHGGCARTLRDLSFEIATAIDTRDLNRLASVYHWAGMSSRSATAVMRRLNAVVQRPLVNIMPVIAPSSASARSDGYRHAGDPSVETEPPRPRVSALRVEQTLKDGHTPSHTVFDLHEYFGCLWIAG